MKGPVVKALSIAGTELRRMFRQRTNIFFVFVFPMMLILILGVTFGGSFTPRIGVVAAGAGPLGDQLVAAVERTPRLDVVRTSNQAELLTQVERGNLQAGLVVPAGYDAAVRAGRDVVVRYLARPDQLSQQLGETVRGAVAGQAALLRAARFAAAERSVPSFDAGLAAATRTAPTVPAVRVTQTTAGTALFSQSLGRFDHGASTQLLLFLFLTSLTGSAALIESRRLGVARRMLATPTPTTVIILGETLGRFVIAIVQGLFIIAGSALIFGVRWGQPLGAAAVLVLFALVGAGAGILLGTLTRNEQQAGAVGLLLGLGLAALGGSMVPLEVFSSTMRKVAHLTPHAWGNDALARLVGHGEGIAGILPQLGVLAGFAAVLLGLATWRLRRVLTA